MSTQPPSEPQPSHAPTLIERVERRRDEMLASLSSGAVSRSTRSDIEAALGAVDRLLTGDVTKLSSTVKGGLMRWLDSSRYLGILAEAPRTTVEIAAVEASEDEAPAAEAPAAEAPAAEAPAVEASADEVAAVEVAAVEASADEVPADEAPAAEAEPSSLPG